MRLASTPAFKLVDVKIKVRPKFSEMRSRLAVVSNSSLPVFLKSLCSSLMLAHKGKACSLDSIIFNAKPWPRLGFAAVGRTFSLTETKSVNWCYSGNDHLKSIFESWFSFRRSVSRCIKCTSADTHHWVQCFQPPKIERNNGLRRF